MKSTMKKVIAVFAVLCVAMTSLASCGEKGNSGDSDNSGNSNSSVEDVTLSPEEIDSLKKQPLSIGEAGDGNPLAIEDPNADLEGEDPVAVATTTKKADSEPTTKVLKVTDSGGQPVTEVVEVTNAEGEKQTDADNQPVTETVQVTEVVTVATEESAETPETTASNYQAKSDGRYAMWLDVSKDENFVFNGDMLEVKFKVKEDIPDGDYKIRISPDLASVEGQTVYPSKVLEGTIRVNNGEIDAADVSGESGFILYGDNVSCKQGDEITFHINMANNSGLVAFCIWFYFDSNALEFIDAYASGEFEEIAKQTDIGAVKN